MCVRSSIAALALALLLPAATAAAQDLTSRAPAQTAPVALVNAAIYPVSSPPIATGHVIFDGGRITAVGAGQPGALPAGTTVIDLAGKRVYPALFAAHTQMGLTEIGAVRATRDFDETGAVTPEVLPAVAINPDSWLMPVARTNGVLCFGVFPTGGVMPGRVSVIAADGWTTTDLAIAPDVGPVIAWPFSRVVRAPWMDQSDEDQLKRIRESQARLRDTLMTARRYLAARDADAARTPPDIRWEALRSLLAPARGQAAHPVFIEAQDYDQITAAVAFALREKLRPIIVGGRDAHLCAALLKQHDVPVIVSSPLLMPRRDDSPIDEAYSLPAKLHAAGVRFAIASGEETPHERNLPYAAAIAVAHGLDAAEALRAITLAPAQILGVADRVGSIEVGKDATLVITTGDPLEVATDTTAAYIRGRPISLDNKQRQLAAKYREKYRQFKGQPANPAAPAVPAGAPAPK